QCVIQLRGRREYSRVLDGSRYYMSAYAEDCQIIGFRSAAGEDDFLRLHIQHPGYLLPCRIQVLPRDLSEMMNTGRVAVYLSHHRKHCFQHLRRDRSRRVVIEVESLHGLTTSLACRLKELACGRHSRPDIRFAVRRRDKSSLELRRRDVHASLQQEMEKLREPGCIALLGRFPIRDWIGRKERGKHRTH